MKKRFRKRERKEALDIDITSLLDILVILLVFLLKSYNPADLKLDLAENIELPDSKSLSFGSNAVMVQVNVDREIFVNQTKIGLINAGSGEKIDILYNELEKIKKENDEKLMTSQKKALTEEQVKQMKEKNQNINIVLDQALPYGVLRKVMHTAAVAGYPKFKFIVQGRY